MQGMLKSRALAPAGGLLALTLLAACGGAQQTTRPTTQAADARPQTQIAAAGDERAPAAPPPAEPAEATESTPDASLAPLAGEAEPEVPAAAEPPQAAPNPTGQPQWWLHEPVRREGKVYATAQSTAESLMAARREALDRAENLLRMATGRELASFDVPRQATRRLDNGSYRVYVLVSAPENARADAGSGDDR